MGLRLLALGALLSGGCQTMTGNDEVPAVIADPTAESRAELLGVVQDAMSGAPVRIADDALTTTSVLIIQRMPQKDLEGRPLTGRDLGRPEHFKLVTNGTKCVLLHEESGERRVLRRTRCKPE